MKKNYMLELLAVAGISIGATLPAVGYTEFLDNEEIDSFSRTAPHSPSPLFLKMEGDQEEDVDFHNGVCSNSRCS